MNLALVTHLAAAVVAAAGAWFYKREANKRQAADDRRREAEHQRREAERDMRMHLMRTSGVPVFHRDTDLGELGAEE